MIELDIDLLSGLLMTDIDLWNRAKKKYSAMSIVVDTGANVTTISKDILFRAGYDVMAGVPIGSLFLTLSSEHNRKGSL